MKKLLLISACLFAFTFLTKAQTIVVDGNMFDWQPTMQLDVAPNAEETTFDLGDDTDPARGSTDPSYFADFDIDDVYGTCDNDFIYLRVKMNSIANTENIKNDTSYHGGGAITAFISVDPGTGDTTGLTWGWWGTGYDYFVQVYPADSVFAANAPGYQQAVWEHKQTSNGYDFEVKDSTKGAKVAWNATNNDVELAIPRSLLNSPKYLAKSALKDSISVMLYAGENNAPWRADYASNPGISGFILNIAVPNAVKDGQPLSVKKYALGQNYPNPFNPSTIIKYNLANDGYVTLRVYNAMGKEVSSLVNDFKSAGTHQVQFSAKNLASGTYFYTLDVNNYHETHKMIILK